MVVKWWLWGVKRSGGCGEGAEAVAEREFFIGDQLVRIHLVMPEMFLVDRPRAMGV